MLRRACLLGADEGFDAVEAVVLPAMWFGAEEKRRRHFIEVVLPLIPATGVCERTAGTRTSQQQAASGAVDGGAAGVVCAARFGASGSVLKSSLFIDTGKPRPSAIAS